MNPTSAAAPSSPKVNDVSGPSVAVENNDGLDGIVANVVGNIPVHSQGTPPVPAGEDQELDKIMHEVGQEIKSAEKKPKHHHLSVFGKKQQKTDVKFSAQPRPIMDVHAQPAPQAHPAPEPSTVAQAKPAGMQKHKAQAKTAAAPKAAKPKSSSALVLVIFMTIMITGALIAAAFYAYK